MYISWKRKLFHYLRIALFWIVLSIIIGIWALSHKPVEAKAPQLKCDMVQKECLQQVAEYYAHIYGLNPDKFLGTINGESGWYINAIGDGGLSNGIAQFQVKTFLRHSEICGFGYTAQDWLDPEAQLRTMACAFSKGMQNEWSAYTWKYGRTSPLAIKTCE